VLQQRLRCYPVLADATHHLFSVGAGALVQRRVASFTALAALRHLTLEEWQCWRAGRARNWLERHVACTTTSGLDRL